MVRQQDGPAVDVQIWASHCSATHARGPVVLLVFTIWEGRRYGETFWGAGKRSTACMRSPISAEPPAAGGARPANRVHEQHQPHGVEFVLQYRASRPHTNFLFPPNR